MASQEQRESLRMRINEEDLELVDDLSLYNDVPFTGVGYLEYPAGRLEREIIYNCGLPDGLCREWFPNGQLARQWHAVRGAGPREVTEWYGDGSVKNVGRYEYGVELEYKEWGKDGVVLVSRKLDSDSPLHGYLERMREVKK